MRKAIETGLRLYTARLGESLTSKGSVASGTLGESIEVHVPKYARGSVWFGQILMADYWEYVDQGRRAGKMPPVQSIYEWLSYPSVRDRFTFGREDKFDESAQMSIAFNIAKKIGEKGTKGNNFATDVFESDLTRQMQGYIEEGVENQFEEMIEEIADIMKD